jgi:hypothetical protein
MPTKFDVGERVEDKKNHKRGRVTFVYRSRSCSTAATKRLMSRVTAFAKSQRGNHECRSCELPREFRRACLRPELRKEKWDRPRKKEPPELAARSAKQGGVRVQDGWTLH